MSPEQIRFREALEGLKEALIEAMEPIVGPIVRFLSRMLG